MPGVTVKLAPLMVYVAPAPAPEGVMVNDLPEQMVPPAAVIAGVVLTVTVVTAGFDTQPFVVPVSA